jgi:hypothetical protein
MDHRSLLFEQDRDCAKIDDLKLQVPIFSILLNNKPMESLRFLRLDIENILPTKNPIFLRLVIKDYLPHKLLTNNLDNCRRALFGFILLG